MGVNCVPLRTARLAPDPANGATEFTLINSAREPRDMREDLQYLDLSAPTLNFSSFLDAFRPVARRRHFGASKEKAFSSASTQIRSFSADDRERHILRRTSRFRRRLFTPAETMGISYDLRVYALGEKLVAPHKSVVNVGKVASLTAPRRTSPDHGALTPLGALLSLNIWLTVANLPNMLEAIWTKIGLLITRAW